MVLLQSTLSVLTVNFYKHVGSQYHVHVSNLHVEYDGVASRTVHLYFIIIGAQRPTLDLRVGADDSVVSDPWTTHELLTTELRGPVQGKVSRYPSVYQL